MVPVRVTPFTVAAHRRNSPQPSKALTGKTSRRYAAKMELSCVLKNRAVTVLMLAFFSAPLGAVPTFAARDQLAPVLKDNVSHPTGFEVQRSTCEEAQLCQLLARVTVAGANIRVPMRAT